MKYRDQEAPNAVQLEMVEGCNLQCSFCAVQGMREKPNTNLKYVTRETLTSVMTQIVEAGWNPRIEWAMHGENTLHPEYIEMVRLARQIAPKLQFMITSNGGGIIRKPGPLANVQALFDAGLNILALDDYQGVNIVPKIRDQIKGKIDGVKFYEYPDETEGNPHSRTHTRTVSFVRDLSVAEKGTHSTMNNHAGVGGPPNDKGQGKRCAKPFRELAVRWDGNVAVCCNDFRGYYQAGNVVTDGLMQVWNSKAMGAARVKLYNRERDFGPCKGCDATSHRVGLLPDKFGKVDLPPPDKSVEKDIADALSRGPLTKPVLRPWELAK